MSAEKKFHKIVIYIFKFLPIPLLFISLIFILSILLRRNIVDAYKESNLIGYKTFFVNNFIENKENNLVIKDVANDQTEGFNVWFIRSDEVKENVEICFDNSYSFIKEAFASVPEQRMSQNTSALKIDGGKGTGFLKIPVCNIIPKYDYIFVIRRKAINKFNIKHVKDDTKNRLDDKLDFPILVGKSKEPIKELQINTIGRVILFSNIFFFSGLVLGGIFGYFFGKSKKKKNIIITYWGIENARWLGKISQMT